MKLRWHKGYYVAEVGPSGTVPHENLEGGIWVLFNKPVVGLQALGKLLTTSPVLSISPALEGTYRWDGSRLLSFAPKDQLAPGTEYSFQVDAGLRSIAGEALTGDIASSSVPMRTRTGWSPSCRPGNCR